VGLCEALVNFSRTFSPQRPAELVRTERYKYVYVLRALLYWSFLTTPLATTSQSQAASPRSTALALFASRPHLFLWQVYFGPCAFTNIYPPPPASQLAPSPQFQLLPVAMLLIQIQKAQEKTLLQLMPHGMEMGACQMLQLRRLSDLPTVTSVFFMATWPL
jgi:hypothetical protein